MTDIPFQTRLRVEGFYEQEKGNLITIAVDPVTNSTSTALRRIPTATSPLTALLPSPPTHSIARRTVSSTPVSLLHCTTALCVNAIGSAPSLSRHPFRPPLSASLCPALSPSMSHPHHFQKGMARAIEYVSKSRMDFDWELYLARLQKPLCLPLG